MYEGTGEGLIDDVFRHFLRKHGVSYIPPGVVRKVDYIITEEIIIAELEDTLKEVYNAVKQLEGLVAGMAKLLNAVLVIIIPFPKRIELVPAPLQRFFKFLRKYEVRGELWLFDIKRQRIIKLLPETFSPSRILRETSDVIKVRVDDELNIPDDSALALIDQLKTYIGTDGDHVDSQTDPNSLRNF